MEGLASQAQAMSPAAMPPGKKRKFTILLILKNLAKVAFLFGFVYGFSLLFDTSNAIIGITIGSALLMFTKVDLGIKPIQASLVIFYLFLHVGLFSYVSLINPYLGILVNGAAIYFMLTLSGQQVQQKSYFPFLTGYVFSVGTPVSGADYGYRLLGLAAGGALTAIVYYLFHRKQTPSRNVLDVFRQIHFTSTRHRFIVRMTVGLVIAMFIGDVFDIQRPAWISMTVLSLTVPFTHEAKKRIVQRVIGTIVGAIVFVILFEYLIPQQFRVWCLLATLFISLFITNYQWQMVFVTINSLNGGMIFYSADVAIEIRLALVFLGIAIVVALNLIAKLDVLDRIDIAVRKANRRRHLKKTLQNQNKQ